MRPFTGAVHLHGIEQLPENFYKSRKPAIQPSADENFRDLVRGGGLNPDNPWIGGYVDYEWEHIRHIFQTADSEISGKVFLEFGCNYGATTIVLAALGATVIAVDVDMKALQIALANARRYDVASRTLFLRCADAAGLPFARDTFDAVVCNSVLEYVSPRMLPAIQRELDRVLKPDGMIFVTGTSNRLSPREIHSGRWLVNYLPQWMGRLVGNETLPRGVSPLQVRFGFGNYDNLDWQDAGRGYLEARARMPGGRWRQGLRKLAVRVSRFFGVSLGLLTPSLSVTLRKRRNGVSRTAETVRARKR